jgi:hypothetical protein
MPKPQSKDLNALLQEVFAADPSLKSKESEVRRLIELMIEQKPDIKIDQAFMKTLKQQILKRVKSLTSSSMKNEIGSTKIPTRRFWPVLGITFAGVGVIAMAVLFVMQEDLLVPKVGKQSNLRVEQPHASIAFNRVASNAFGAIDISSASQPTGMGGGGLNAMAAAPLAAPMAANDAGISMESVKTVSATTAPSIPVADSKMVTGRMIMPPYEQTVIEYEYKGEPLNIEGASTDVFKRTQTSFSAGNLASAIRGLNIGVANIGTFEQATVSDISIYQNIPHGYQIYISPRMGTMSIDQNWEQWKDANVSCSDDACWRASQLKRSDVPSDDELVKIADQFMDQHQIDRSSYGKGEVDKSWEAYSNSADSNEYIPDVMQVVYPLMINGQAVYQNGGNKVGLNVGVNIRVKRVSSVYNIQQLSFDQSKYDPETDTQALLDSAKKGGLASPIRYLASDPNVKMKTVTAELGTPVQGLVQIYQYKDNQSFELYVPALIFPVTKRADSDQVWTPSQIIVPLVKGVESDMPQIMPMMKGGAVESSAGGAGVSGSAGASAGTEVIPPEPSVMPMMAR